MIVPPGYDSTENRPIGPSRLRSDSLPDLLFRADFRAQKIRPKTSLSLKFSKKLPRIWCNSYLTLLSSAYFPQKSHRKNAKKRPKIDFFYSFLAFFSPFWLLFPPTFWLPPFCAFCRPFLPRLSALVCTPSSQRAKGKSRSVRASIPVAPGPLNRANRPRFCRHSIACQEGPRESLLQVPYFSSTYSQRKFADNLPQIA